MAPLTDTLCLHCGLCCNGVLFADVRPGPGDGSPLFGGRKRVAQPCPAFGAGDCKCAIYAERPQRCRQFECRQLLGVAAGEIPAAAARRRIAKARRLAARVEKGLAALGFKQVHWPLKRRFQHCQRAAEAGELDASQYSKLAEVQLAMHQLNQLLAEEFYG